MSPKLIISSLMLLMLLLTGGCSPEYNWRETSVAQQRAQIAFPGKVQTEARELKFGVHQLAFSLVSAHVGPSVFAVGYVELPPTMTPDQTDELVAGFIQGLSRQLGASLTHTPRSGEMFELVGTVAGKPSHLWAKVLVHRGMLIQVAASGPKENISAEQALTFMQSLQLK